MAYTLENNSPRQRPSGPVFTLVGAVLTPILTALGVALATGVLLTVLVVLLALLSFLCHGRKEMLSALPTVPLSENSHISAPCTMKHVFGGHYRH